MGASLPPSVCMAVLLPAWRAICVGVVMEIACVALSYMAVPLGVVDAVIVSVVPDTVPAYPFGSRMFCVEGFMSVIVAE